MYWVRLLQLELLYIIWNNGICSYKIVVQEYDCRVQIYFIYRIEGVYKKIIYFFFNM